MVPGEDGVPGWGDRNEAPLQCQLPPRAEPVSCSPGTATKAKASTSLGPGGAEGTRYRGKPHVAHGVTPVIDVVRVPKVQPGCLEEKLESG